MNNRSNGLNYNTEGNMSHSITKIWIHGIFSTKNREALIIEELEAELYSHIRNNLINQFHCYVKSINGIPDHVHILFLLNHNFSIQEIFHSIKGESSHWINQNNFIKTKFAWQIGYGAFSIGESRIDEVEKYIKNQKGHHRKLSFKDEYDLFIKKYKIELSNNTNGFVNR